MDYKPSEENPLIQDMLRTAVDNKDTQSISFLTKLCLDHEIPMETIKEWSSS